MPTLRIIVIGGTPLNENSRQLGSSVALALSALRLAPPDTQHFRHPHEIGERARGHCPHDMPAVDLDGNLAQPQFAGDLLVHQAGSDKPHHLAFALGQAVEACPQVCEALLVLAPAAIALDRRGDCVQHVLIAEGLGQKIDRAGFHGLDGHGDIAVAGHEYDGNMDVRLGEFGLEIEPAHPRQSDVEHEAACHIGKLASQKVRGRAERLDPEADRSEQAAERLAHGLIVVDDEYDRRFGRSSLASWTLDHGILSGQQDLPAIDSTFTRIIEPANELRPRRSRSFRVCLAPYGGRLLFMATLNQSMTASIVRLSSQSPNIIHPPIMTSVSPWWLQGTGRRPAAVAGTRTIVRNMERHYESAYRCSRAGHAAR